jgi:hypothetical protein
VKEFFEYGKRKGLRYKAIKGMIHAIFYDLRGVEHLVGGFMGLKWNGYEWIERRRIH